MRRAPVPNQWKPDSGRKAIPNVLFGCAFGHCTTTQSDAARNRLLPKSGKLPVITIYGKETALKEIWGVGHRSKALVSFLPRPFTCNVSPVTDVSTRDFSRHFLE